MLGTYDPQLIGLSCLVAMVASYAALDLATRIAAARGPTVLYWLIGGAVAMGIGIWSMHFVGMLAFRLPLPMAYQPTITVVSLIIAILVCAFALFIVSRSVLSGRRLALAGTTMGLGIAAMHYVGMAALLIAPGIDYDWRLVAGSVAIAIAASCTALWLAFALRVESTPRLLCKKIGSAAVMGVAIVSMHFTGMAAAKFSANTFCLAPLEASGDWLAWSIGGGAVLLLGALMLNSAIDANRARSLAAANEQILRLAQTDALTGLTNRRAFLERLGVACAVRRRTGGRFALMLLDLDNFKSTNDTLGHPAGDRLLQEVATRLCAAVREGDLVARLGGDEFAILAAEVAEPADAGSLAVRIGTALAAPCNIAGIYLQLTASIGIAVSPAADKDIRPDDLVMQADLALYRAKDDGRNCYRFHTAELDRRVHESVVVAKELRTGIERGELELHYQPQVDLYTSEIVGLEALVRWNHPTRGLLPPGEFIPVAERTGSIVALGRWVIDDVCRQLRTWRDEGISPPRVAVNVSALQLRRGCRLVQDVESSLSRWGVPAGDLEIELTESVLMEAEQRHRKILGRLQRMGVRIAIDDFGTGYSSLAYLAAHEVSRLKIAQALVFPAPDDRRYAAVVKAAVELGHTLGIQVIAEGVETEAHVRFLAAVGCGQAQGYHYGRPVPVEQATKLLQRLEPASLADEFEASSMATEVIV